MPALHHIIAPAVLNGLTTLELGVVMRLVIATWDVRCPGVIEASSLAAVAGVTNEECAAVRPRVLLALGSAPLNQHPEAATTAQDAIAGHLVFQAVRSAFDAAAATLAADVARRAEISARRSSAGLEGARRRWQRMAHDGNCHPLPSAPSLRSESSESSALALQRTPLEDKKQSAQDVIAQLSAGARAQVEGKLSEWRRTQVVRLLQDAIARWAAKGVTNCPASKASEIADGPYSTPARIQTLIEHADALVAAGQCRSPLGVIIAGVCMSEATRRREPVLVRESVQAHWDQREREYARMAETSLAITAARLRAASPEAAPVARRGVS